MALFAKRPTEEVHLVLDVGNGSVGGALVLFTPAHLPNIIYSKRLPLSIPEKTGSQDLTTRVLAMLKEILTAVSSEGVEEVQKLKIAHKKIKHVACVLSSPWYVSKTKILKINSAEPVFLTKNLVESLLLKEEHLFYDELLQSDSSANSRDIETIEKKVIQATLNGYHTTHPYQKKARDVELSMYMSVAQKNVLRSIERLVATFFSHNIVFFSYALSEYRVIEHLFPNDSNFVFMDITAEVTDVSSVEQHILMETSSFPFGKNYLIQRIAKELAVLPDIALSSIAMYAREHMSVDSSQKIKEAYEKAVGEWAQYALHSITDIVKGTTPSKIFVTVDNDVAPLFMEAVKKILTQDRGDTPIHFSTTAPVLLDDEVLSHAVEFFPHVKKDPFLSLEAIFCNLLFNEDHI